MNYLKKFLFYKNNVFKFKQKYKIFNYFEAKLLKMIIQT